MAAPSTAETMPRGQYKKIFIIDDDIEDQEIFIEAVREVEASIACSGTTSGEEALELLGQMAPDLPDLIFLDLNMPRLNGKQVLKEIKDSLTFRQIPVIMYSTSFAPRDIEEVTTLGASFHLLKPSRFDELCQSLRVVLSKEW